MYLQVLRDGRLPPHGMLIDLGCGQGLMLALIASAADEWRQGRWPSSWPPPPLDLRLHGIETRPRVARRASQALEGAATIEEVDVSSWALPSCEAVLLFDVLHLLSRDTQDRLMEDAARVLPHGGVLVIREADADAGWQFQMVRAGNRFNALWQGRGLRRFCFDSVAGWTSRLTRLGFDVESMTRHDSGPFGNVLLQLRAEPPARPDRTDTSTGDAVGRALRSGPPRPESPRERWRRGRRRANADQRTALDRQPVASHGRRSRARAARRRAPQAAPAFAGIPSAGRRTRRRRSLCRNADRAASRRLRSSAAVPRMRSAVSRCCRTSIGLDAKRRPHLAAQPVDGRAGLGAGDDRQRIRRQTPQQHAADLPVAEVSREQDGAAAFGHRLFEGGRLQTADQSSRRLRRHPQAADEVDHVAGIAAIRPERQGLAAPAESARETSPRGSRATRSCPPASGDTRSTCRRDRSGSVSQAGR